MGCLQHGAGRYRLGILRHVAASRLCESVKMARKTQKRLSPVKDVEHTVPVSPCAVYSFHNMRTAMISPVRSAGDQPGERSKHGRSRYVEDTTNPARRTQIITPQAPCSISRSSVIIATQRGQQDRRRQSPPPPTPAAKTAIMTHRVRNSDQFNSILLSNASACTECQSLPGQGAESSQLVLLKYSPASIRKIVTACRTCARWTGTCTLRCMASAPPCSAAKERRGDDHGQRVCLG